METPLQDVESITDATLSTYQNGRLTSREVDAECFSLNLLNRVSRIRLVNSLMLDEIARLRAEIEACALDSPAALEAFKSAYTGRKGAVTALFETFRGLSGPEKAPLGKALNELKHLAQSLYQ